MSDINPIIYSGELGNDVKINLNQKLILYLTKPFFSFFQLHLEGAICLLFNQLKSSCHYGYKRYHHLSRSCSCLSSS